MFNGLSIEMSQANESLIIKLVLNFKTGNWKFKNLVCECIAICHRKRTQNDNVCKIYKSRFQTDLPKYWIL